MAQQGGFEMEVELPVPEGMPDVPAEMETPYRILVVADYAGSKEGQVGEPLASRRVSITPQSFDEVLAACRPSVDFTIADPTQAGSVMSHVQLGFDSLRAFQPGQIAAGHGPARQLLALRECVVQRMQGRLSPEQLAGAVATMVAADPALAWAGETIRWTPAPPPAAGSAVDSLLAQIDLGDEGPSEPAVPPPKTGIAAVVAAAAGAGGAASLPAGEASAMRRTLAEIDRRLSLWLNALLHHPAVQSLEAAWRSLHFLVSHMEFRRGLELSILHSRKDELIERLTGLLIDPVFDAGEDAPDLIVVDMQFTNSAPDIEILDSLAQNATSLPAMALAGVGPEFFGLKHSWQMPALPNIVGMFDQWQFAKWNTLRARPYARMLGVIFGRGLLRGPHGGDGQGDLQFHFREEVQSDRDLVWAGGPIAAACAVAAGVARTGWPTAISGFVRGRVEDFATAEGGRKGEKQFGPTDTRMVPEKIQELAAGGINALVTPPGQSAAVIWNGLSAARPARWEPAALHEVSLPYQLFAARLSQLLLGLKPIIASMAHADAQAAVTALLVQWLGYQSTPDPGQLQVQVGVPEQGPKVPQLAVRVVPPPHILPGGIPVVLGYPLT